MQPVDRLLDTVPCADDLSWLLRWAVADNQQTQLSWHSKHAFSA